ncbi:MAG TPA: LCP family protein [Anaerolineaceae bacterium]|nr:LCP family protein [Anaerolineaceae bacterium]
MASRPISSKRLNLGVLIAFVLLGGIAAILSFVLVKNLIASWSISDIGGAPVIQPDTQPTPTLQAGETPMPTPIVTSQPLPEALAKPWDGNTRVTVLVMGLDYRDYLAGDIPRTDTMMLVTYDPQTNAAGILSIPRDLWVSIPDYGYDRINTAYFFGEANKLPGGGPGKAVQTVEQLLGVPINYYARIDFGAFVEFIDEIGGVIVEVPETITIDLRGDQSPVTIKPGQYTLDGELSLAYARSRKSQGGDFDRAQRQQQVVMGLFNRVKQPEYWSLMLSKFDTLYRIISEGVYTNLTLDQAISLAVKARDIPANNVAKGAIGPQQVLLAKIKNQDVLIPLPDKIRLLRDEIFNTSGASGPAAVGGDKLELAKAENARISIKNGTFTQGLASRTGDYFKAQGLNITEVADAGQNYAGTTIFIYGNAPYAASYLAELMNVPTVNIISQFTSDTQVDIVVVLGNDWANSNSLP